MLKKLSSIVIASALATPVFAATYLDQASFESAAGNYAVDSFESYSNNFNPLASDPLLNITFDTMDGIHYPTVEDSSQIGGTYSSPTNVLGNVDQVKSGDDGPITIRPAAGYMMTSVGYWNVGGEDTTTLSAYDSNGNLLDAVTTPAGTQGDFIFQGVVENTPIAYAVISHDSGYAWFTIDDLHVTTAVPEPASLTLVGFAAMSLLPRRKRQ